MAIPALADTVYRQVEIEARVVEVTEKFTKELGVKWTDALAKVPGIASDPAIADGTNALGSAPSSDAVTNAFFPVNAVPGQFNLATLLTDAQVAKIVNALSKTKEAELMTVPKIFFPNNQPGFLTIPTESADVRLKLTPTISPDGKTIGLTITPEVDDALQPLINVKVGSGGDKKPPGIGDIPVLGAFFKSDQGDNKSERLIIFIQPRVVNVLEGEDDGGGSGGPVDAEITGTGQTIGRVADLKLKNRTKESQIIIVPPVIIESVSQENQDYVCPGQQEVALKPEETKTVPMDGVCINRDKPPADKSDKDDLVINTGNPTIPRQCHHSPKQARDLIRFTRAKYDCADQLQQDGELKDFPYTDKKEQKEILVQWSIWNDPRICQTTDSPPATQDDLQQVVYKQAEKKGRIPRDAKKKLDDGIDTIFEKVELTNEKAKELETPDPFEGVELTGDKAKGNQSSDSPNEKPPVIPP